MMYATGRQVLSFSITLERGILFLPQVKANCEQQAVQYNPSGAAITRASPAPIHRPTLQKNPIIL